MFKDYPTADYAPYESETMNMQCGDVVFRIEGAEYDDPGTPLSGTIQVESIDDIKFSFDLPDNEEDPRSIEIEMGSTEVVLWDDVLMSDGSYKKLHETLYGADFSRYPFECSITVTRDGETVDFLFNFSYDDIDFDQKSRKVTLELQSYPPKEIDETMGASIVETPTTKPFASGEVDQSSSHVATPFGELLSRYFQLLYGLENTPPTQEVFLDSTFTTGTETLGGNGWWVWYNPTQTIPDDASLVLQIASAAALEGAIYGYAFGRGFYVNRTSIDTNQQVTIDDSAFDNIEVVERRNIKFSRIQEKVLLFSPEDQINLGDPMFWDFVNRPNFSYSRYNEDYLDIATDTEDYDSLEDDQFNIVFSRLRLAYLSYDSISEELSQVNQTDFDTEHERVAGVGRDAYGKALGAERPLRIKISGGWGIFTLRPYQSFRVTGTEVSDIFIGKDFRVSEITYSLETDKFEVEAYEV